MRLPRGLPQAPGAPDVWARRCRECGGYAIVERVDPSSGDRIVGCRDCRFAVAHPDQAAAWDLFGGALYRYQAFVGEVRRDEEEYDRRQATWTREHWPEICAAARDMETR